jgi:hypothetical protein
MTDLVEVCEEVEINPAGTNGPEITFTTTTTTTPVGGGPTTYVTDSSYMDNDGLDFQRTYEDGSYDRAQIRRGYTEHMTFGPPNVDGCSDGTGFRFTATGIHAVTTTCTGATPVEAVDDFGTQEITVCVDGVEKTMKTLGTTPV